MASGSSSRRKTEYRTLSLWKCQLYETSSIRYVQAHFFRPKRTEFITPQPQQTLFSRAEFMAVEPARPKGRSRKADSSSLSLFDWVLSLVQERGLSRSARDARSQHTGGGRRYVRACLRSSTEGFDLVRTKRYRVSTASLIVVYRSTFRYCYSCRCTILPQTGARRLLRQALRQWWHASPSTV